MKLKQHAVGRTDLLRFRYDQIAPKPGLNVRDWTLSDNIAAVAEMAEMIETESGIISPIVVALHKDGAAETVLITDGETRWRAVGLLIEQGRATAETYLFPAMPEPAGRNDKSRDIDLFIRNSGRQFLPLEAAALVARLVTRGMTEAEIAKATGKGPSQIANLLVLASADAELHDMVRDDKVKATTVMQAWRQHGTAATKLIREAYQVEAGKRIAAIEQAEEVAIAPPAPVTAARRSGRPALSQTEKAARKVDKLSQAPVRVSAKKLGLTKGNTDPAFTALLTFVQYVATKANDASLRAKASKCLTTHGYSVADAA